MRLIGKQITCLTLGLAAIALTLGGAGSAKAGPITTLFNTGVNGGGTPLADGTIGDPHYQLVFVPGGTTDIRIRTSVGGFPIPPWLGDNLVSAWIGPNNDTQVDGPVGVYDYQTTFTLPSAGTVTISGQWATDNPGVDILLNGVSSGSTSAGFTSWTPFTITGAGVAGVNKLDFQLLNQGGPTGLRVEQSGAFTAAVPEPASLTLLGFGAVTLCGYVGLRRRKALARRTV